MPSTTPVNAIPYPLDADAPDGAAQIKATATLLDTLKWGSRNLKPSVGVKAASEGLILTTSYQDVPTTAGHLEITPAVTSLLLVVASFSFFNVSGVKTIIGGQGTIKVDSEAEQSALAEYTGAATINQPKPASQVYAVSLSAAKHTIKLRARRNSATAEEECTLLAANTRFIYALFAS